jgi:hypothetical protein
LNRGTRPSDAEGRLLDAVLAHYDNLIGIVDLAEQKMAQPSEARAQ